MTSQQISIENIDKLASISELTPEAYQEAKKEYLSRGQSNKLIKLLQSRCKLPKIRNLHYPAGELYAPVTWTSDYIIKYIIKNSWGLESAKGDHRYIISITAWDLLVIDIDEIDRLPYIKKRIERYYPNDLFRIHKTPRGYHLYLVSRKLNHCTAAAIYMRLKLATDVAHGTNSLYTGSSIRLTRKSHEPADQVISDYVETFGNGKECPEAKAIYNSVCYWLDYFHKTPSDYTLMDNLGAIYDRTPIDFGWVHVVNSSPYRLSYCNNHDDTSQSWQLTPNMGFLFQTDHNLWSKFIKYQTIRYNELVPLLFCTQKQMGFSNLYRILKAEEDYAIGIHVQHNVHFISFKDLLFIDYDTPHRLGIVARWARKNPECRFRIVKSRKGYHAFLTSHKIYHHSVDSMRFLMNLCSDPAHILGVYHRGYSVRINQKHADEKPYREVCSYGKGEEDPRLVELYKLHLELYQENCEKKTNLCQYQRNKSRSILKKDGPMSVY